MRISEEIRAKTGEASLLGACDRLVQQMVPSQLGAERAVDVIALATRMGISLVKADGRMPFEGRFRRLPNGGPEITYVNRKFDPRLRFTIAHEIGHFLIDECLGNRESDMFRSPISNAGVRRDEEYVADAIAASILMPRTDFLAFTHGNLTFQVLDRGMRRFGVSRAAFVRRFAVVAGRDVFCLTAVPSYFKKRDSCCLVDDGWRATPRSASVSLRRRVCIDRHVRFCDLEERLKVGVRIRVGKSSVYEIRGDTHFKYGLVPKIEVLSSAASKCRDVGGQTKYPRRQN